MNTSAPTPAARRTPRLGRIALVVALVGVLVVLVYLVGTTQRSGDITGTPGGTDVEGGGVPAGDASGTVQPATIESISPSPDDLVGPRPDIAVDLANGYTGVIQVDGIEIPNDQTIRVDSLGQFTFRPGPDYDIEAFEPGVHTVRVIYWPVTSTRSDSANTFDWSFRVSGV